jgi:hypothetical protein
VAFSFHVSGSSLLPPVEGTEDLINSKLRTLHPRLFSARPTPERPLRRDVCQEFSSIRLQAAEQGETGPRRSQLSRASASILSERPHEQAQHCATWAGRTARRAVDHAMREAPTIILAVFLTITFVTIGSVYDEMNGKPKSTLHQDGKTQSNPIDDMAAEARSSTVISYVHVQEANYCDPLAMAHDCFAEFRQTVPPKDMKPFSLPQPLSSTFSVESSDPETLVSPTRIPSTNPYQVNPPRDGRTERRSKPKRNRITNHFTDPQQVAARPRITPLLPDVLKPQL